MVIDTSALLAILTYELEAEHFAAAIQDAPARLISAASLLECAIVIEARYGEAGGRKLLELEYNRMDTPLRRFRCILEF